jgi:hypothetical protein
MRLKNAQVLVKPTFGGKLKPQKSLNAWTHQSDSQWVPKLWRFDTKFRHRDASKIGPKKNICYPHVFPMKAAVTSG